MRIIPPPVCHFTAGWSARFQAEILPENVASANDRKAFVAAGLLPPGESGPGDHLTSALLRQAFGARTSHGGGPQVIYISAPARIQGDDVLLLGSDYRPVDAPLDGVSLSESLKELARGGNRRKLLVLDLGWELRRGELGFAPERVAQQAIDVVERVVDPGRITLVSCGPGQCPMIIAGAGRSAFGYFFENALLGRADGWGPVGADDGRVTASEACAYVCQKVEGWTVAAGIARQTPVVLGSGDDFALTAVRGDEVRAAQFLPEEQTLPSWIAERRSQWSAMFQGSALALRPRLLRRYADAIGRAERGWRYGGDAKQLAAILETEAAPLVMQIDESCRNASQTAVVSLAQASHGKEADPKLVAVWTAYLNAASRQDPTAAPDLATAQRAAAKKKFKETIAEIDAVDLALAAMESLRLASEDFVPRLIVVDDELREIWPSPIHAETALAHRLRVRVQAGDCASESLRAALATACRGEQAASYVEAVDWVTDTLSEGWMHWQAGEASLFSPGYADEADCRRSFQLAETAFAEAQEVGKTCRSAATLRDRAS
ncbi:MAG: hypothetical protein KDA61_20740, partial [Planctomycetales bacterium]|nr:hypothetical protein [Planctomycetales bacterium]